MLKPLPCPISGDHRCKSRDCELHYMLAPATVAVVKDILKSTLDVDWAMVDLRPEARVRRGMAHVRATYPLAVRDVLGGVLDTMTLERCVLGQIHGNYDRSPEGREASISWLQAHGFVPLVVDTITESEDAHELDLVWRNAFAAWFAEVTG
jgi:hypothetical protein